MENDLVDVRRIRQLKNLLNENSPESIATFKVLLFAMSTVILFALLCLSLAAFVKIEETTVANGYITPKNDIIIIQHLEGGIIKNILVSEGQTVEPNQLLMELDPATTISELESAKSRRLQAQMNVVRLLAFTKGEILTKDKIISAVKDINANNYQDFAKYIEAAIELNEEQTLNKNSSLQELQEGLVKTKSELTYVQKSIANIEKQYSFATERRKIYEELRQTQSISQLSFIESKENETVALGKIIEARAQEEALKNTIKIIQEQIDGLDATNVEKALEDLTKSQAQLLEVENAITRLTEQQNRLKIVAKDHGIIKGLIASVGNVISPGEKIMEIVPLDEPLVAKVKIDPKDISHISTGSKARLKISAFDYNFYGTLTGVVHETSKSTFDDERTGPYYESIIKLDKNFFNQVPGKNMVLPGMLVTADIITGKKTILRYFLHPIDQALFSALKLDR